MAGTFDPYYKWLGIPPEQQPANHYRLLGVRDFEPDPDVISHAADRQMAHVRTFQAGKHSSLTQEMLNELSVARLVLLNPAKKAAYDEELRHQRAGEVVPPPLDAGEFNLSPSHRSSATAARGQGGWVKLGMMVTVLVASIVLVTWLVFSEPEGIEPGTTLRGESAGNRAASSVKTPLRAAVTGRIDSKKEKEGESLKSHPAIEPQGAQSLQHLVFMFDDEGFAKKYWQWNDPWTMSPDGGRAPRGPASFLRSRHGYLGDVSITMDFSFAQAKFSNTGGCWINVWGQRLLITNGWRRLNAEIQIRREENEIVYSYSGQEKRISVSEETWAQPTPVEIRWRSRTAHFRRIEIKAQSLVALD